jgi:membrane protease YdiL (CAAX protease family)
VDAADPRQSAYDGRAATSPAPGWYADPASRYRWRFWDGRSWTDGVSDGVRVLTEPLPRPDVDRRVQLPFRAIWWALGGIVAGELFGALLAYLADLASDDRFVAELIASQLGLWAGFAGAITGVSRRYGTGRLLPDFGVRMRPGDQWVGLGASVLMRLAGMLALLPLVLVFSHYFDHAPRSGGPFDGSDGDTGAVITVAVIAAIGAPFIEEILFRGVVMGALRRFGRWRAIVLQGLVFGAVHLQPTAGRANILTFVAIAVGGFGLGWLADHYRRLGPGMWAHFFFNLLAVAIVLTFSF